jgi:hypothetical protein
MYIIKSRNFFNNYFIKDENLLYFTLLLHIYYVKNVILSNIKMQRCSNIIFILYYYDYHLK